MSDRQPMNVCCGLYADALRELIDAVEAKADIGKRRQLSISPRMEDALKFGEQLLSDAAKEKTP